MDNKKWYNRFGTVFWWTLTILPLVVALIYFIGYHLTFNSGISSAQELSEYHMDLKGDYLTYLEYVLTNSDTINFGSITMSFLSNMFYDLFDLLSISLSDEFNILFGYMVSVQFYHMIFDFIVWLPRWFHCIMEKGFGKVS